MSREFNGTSDLITRPGAIVTAPPFTFSCWVYLDALPAANAIAIYVGQGSSTDNRHNLNVLATGLVIALSRTTVNGSSTLGPTLQIKRWHHIAGVWTSTTNRNHAVDGVFGTANTASLVPAGIDRTAFGVLNGSTQSFWFPGHMGPIAVWNAALSASEIMLLANHTHPTRIKRGNLVLFSELDGRGSFEIDRITATPLDAKFTRIGRSFPQPIDRTARIYSFPSASGITGTLAVTEADDTLAAAGIITVSGTLAVTEADDTLAASGTVTVSGTLAVTEADDALSAAGTITVSGTLAITEAHDTLAAAGLLGVFGTLAVTEADDTLIASGTSGTVSSIIGGTRGSIPAIARSQSDFSWVPIKRRVRKKKPTPEPEIQRASPQAAGEDAMARMLRELSQPQQAVMGRHKGALTARDNWIEEILLFEVIE